MTEIEEHPPNQVAQLPQHPTASTAIDTIHHTIPPLPSDPDRPDVLPTSDPASTSMREPLAITAINNDTHPMAAAPHPLTREKTAPAIGPSLDKPAPLPQQSEMIGPSLLITLLLITGARHPYKIDEKYLRKRNVTVEGNNPVNMSVYTLKELIWREWREGEQDAPENAWRKPKTDRLADSLQIGR
ncbi:MAG: hypothetical protein LQ337_005618 [Flavoplaca oasis]|nr:MAG: hypothetical protein LQ337_005618 [Flavoplaca oasis]